MRYGIDILSICLQLMISAGKKETTFIYHWKALINCLLHVFVFDGKKKI